MEIQNLTDSVSSSGGSEIVRCLERWETSMLSAGLGEIVAEKEEWRKNGKVKDVN
jgi:hypothetical protein